MANDIGVVGLAVMGQNLALNIASKGFNTAVFNRTVSKVDDAVQRAKAENISSLFGFKDVKSFVSSLKCPRKIVMLVKAGSPVDATIKELTPFLEKNDLIIDGGNEWYENTEKRAKMCAELGIRYMGMGVSGGEEGARHGPSLMPGGSKDSYKDVEHILIKIAAQVDDGPCVSYVGPGGSGNYVKMVHNGIEYGDMELISEAYTVLKEVCGSTNQELQTTFSAWNATDELQSFLIEITAKIFEKQDDVDPSKFLLDFISDRAGSKGTGMWTIQEAIQRGIPCPTIAAALDMRYLSGLTGVRRDASAAFSGPRAAIAITQQEKDSLTADMQHALFCSKICSYAQGMMLLQAASKENNWNLNFGEVARTWKGGCIIRAKFLDKIKSAFDTNSNIESLLIDPYFAERLQTGLCSWRRVVQKAQSNGVPVPALSASLSYFDSCRAAKLPTNMVQAQRDFFGAHTFERIDKKGIFHANWTN